MSMSELNLIENIFSPCYSLIGHGFKGGTLFEGGENERIKVNT
jgi:hypothetical protein